MGKRWRAPCERARLKSLVSGERRAESANGEREERRTTTAKHLESLGLRMSPGPRPVAAPSAPPSRASQSRLGTPGASVVQKWCKL